MDPEIVNYIRDHRDTYTREVIIQHLIEAGHSQEAIDAAWWQTVDPARAATTAAPAQQSVADEALPLLRRWRFWQALLGYIVGLLVVTNFLNVINFFAGLLFYGAALLFGLIYPILRFQKDRTVAVGILFGLAVVVLLLFVMPGLCTVAAGDL